MYIQKILRQYAWNFILFFMIFTSVIIYSYFERVDMSIGDAGWYLTIGDSCWADGLLHLEEFPKTFRGCLFPLYLQLLKHSFWGVRIGWALTSASMLGLLFAVVLPLFFGCEVKKREVAIGTILAYIYIYIAIH